MTSSSSSSSSSSSCYIDCHAHLYSSTQYQPSDIPDIIQKAKDANVKAIVCVSETLNDARSILELSRQHTIIKPCAGLHPVQQSINNEKRPPSISELDPMLTFIRQNVNDLIGIGEIGLDFSPHIVGKKGSSMIEDRKEIQKAIFKSQIKLADEFDIMLNVHSRNAGYHAITTLLETTPIPPRTLFHAFDGRPIHALRALVHKNIFFSIAPSILWDHDLQVLAKKLPMESLVLETDSPALGPIRGTINYPHHIGIAASEIAKIKNLNEDQVIKILLENSKRLFGDKFNYTLDSNDC